MAKLTAAQVRSIETVLYHLERANKYLASDDVALCKRRTMATTTLDYTRADGAVLCEVAKDIGSDIVGYEMAMGYLKNFLTFNMKA